MKKRADGRGDGYDIGKGWGCAADQPAHFVSWFDVLKWCNLKSDMEGLRLVYAVDGSIYRPGSRIPRRYFRELQEKLAPVDQPTRHGKTWGGDNGFSHLRASLMGPGITLPVVEGALLLGTWQQIAVVDHDKV